MICDKPVGASPLLEHDHLTKLHEAAVALSGISSLAEFGRVATQQMELLLDFEIATIWRWLPEEGLLELTWYSGWPCFTPVSESRPVRASSARRSRR